MFSWRAILAIGGGAWYTLSEIPGSAGERTWILMRLQRINYAEAVIEAFFDGSDTDRPANRISPLTHYKMTSNNPEAVYAWQCWCGAEIVMNGGAPAWLEMERECDLNIQGFDRLRIFESVPKTVFKTVKAKIDGEWQSLCDREPGTDTPDECDYPISGKRMEALLIRLEHDGSQDRGALYKWIGLTDTAREEAMLALHSEYPTDWPDLLKEEGDFEPHIGIYFGKEELEVIRRRVKDEPFKAIYERIKAEAESHLNDEPEKDIGQCVPHPDNRWARKRDLHKKGHHDTMQLMAFVGLVERNADMMKMAVRMALSAVHCTRWTEGEVMGALNGTPWHHRSFTEEIFCKGCAMVLDWAGGWLTEHAQESIVDAIVMKGLPRIESDFKRMEYIRGMNQGIVFSGGRIFGLMACAHYYPRYKGQILEAERDFHEMINDYIQPDGGTPEGQAYWNYTFGNAMPTLYVLSRFHGGAFADILTPELEKTALFGLSEMSVVGDGGCYLPVNDAGSHYYSPLLMAACYKLTGREDFAKLLSLSLKNSELHGAAGMDVIIMAPDQVPEVEKYAPTGYIALPDLGQARIIREDKEQGRIGLSFFTGLADVGHFHMDKGSFILETEREALLIDRGTLPYSHPDMALAQMPEYHNLLFPELSGARVRQNPTRDGAYLVGSSYENGVFEALGDVTKAWTDRRILKNTRRIVSGDVRTYLFEDEMILSEEAPVSFLLNTPFPCERDGNAVLVKGEHSTVRVEPVGWQPVEIECVPFGVNGALQPVWRIAFRSGAKQEHRLTTKITLL